jgi:hypothetical protein
MKRILPLIALLLCVYALPCYGLKTIEIQWDDLIPKLPPQDNPLADLSEEEAGFIEYIIYLREVLPKEITPENQEYSDEVNKALPELMKKGIDVDKIIEERRYRNSAVNTELDNQVIKLSGYLLPLDLSGNAVTDFLLVPYFGACIHTPPPPQNQIVHAISANPTLYEVNDMFKPVSVTGRLKAKSSSKELFLNDGSNDVNIGYSLSVEKIEDYQP